MAYTTRTAILLRLKGWATTSPLTSFSETEVDPDLIDMLIEEADGRINQCLSDRYTVPIAGGNTALKSCAEKLVMCQLIGQLYAGQEPSENGGYGALMCSQGERELRALKVLDLVGATPLGKEISTPISGTRSLPPIYNTPKTKKIDTIQW